MIDAAALLAEAQAKAGFGDGDGADIQAGFEVLVASLNAQAMLSVTGEDSARRNLLTRLEQRLEAQKWLRNFPRIGDEVIDKPVFLTGLPRSGTTFFQYLFDRDPRFRLARTWEAISPHPPPGYDPASVAQRQAEESARRKASRPDVAGFEAVHLHDNGGPEECHAFMEQAHGAAGLFNLFDVPDYWDWLVEDADWQAIYQIHKRQLQLLQWRSPRPRWALKYPAHVLAMEATVAVHPDARFVITHRDPVQVLASLCKLTVMLRGSRSASPPDPHRVGIQMLAFLRAHVDAILAFDVGSEAQRVVHVDYYRLLADPAKAMEAVHEGLGIDSPAPVRAAVAEWHRDNPKGARGANPYALADYGLDEGEVAKAFGDYMERFAIPREAEGLRRD